MYESLTHVNRTRVREVPLLIDSGAGVILEATPLASISRRNIDHNPYIVSKVHQEVDEPPVEHIFAGPDAVAASQGQRDLVGYVEYVVIRESAGFLELTRVA